MSTNNMSANNMCETPSSANEFQSNMKDLLEKMGADQKCKAAADSFFDSGSSSSGSNLQEGSSSNKMDSSLNTNVTGNTTNVVIEGPKATFLGQGVSTGKIETQNQYTASNTNSNLSTEQKSSQLNLTQQQAEAFNRGASKMSSEGCGTVVLNATKISNTKKKMNCFLKSRKYDSSVNVKIGNEIIIRPIEVDCTKFTSAIVQDKCLERLFNSVLNISGAKLTQKANANVKTQISLTDSDKKTLADMQKEIANNIVEGKLTTDNKLDALPPSAKDIMTKDTTIDESISNKSVDEKISKASISLEGGNKIVIEYQGSLDARNLVIDQDAVATMITELLFNDSVEVGVSAASEIQDQFKKQTGISLSASGQDLAAIADSGNKGNAAAITAGQAGVTTAASNQVAVDTSKLAAGNADMNESNADVIDSKGKSDAESIKATGDNSVNLSVSQGDSVKGMINANNWGQFVGYIAGGVIFLVAIGIYFWYKSKNKKESSDNKV